MGAPPNHRQRGHPLDFPILINNNENPAPLFCLVVDREMKACDSWTRINSRMPKEYTDSYRGRVASKVSYKCKRRKNHINWYSLTLESG
jgi:hypothetical protein